MKMTTHKAWVSALFTLAMALLYKFGVISDAPSPQEVTDAIYAIGESLLYSGAAYFVTWLIPNKKKSAGLAVAMIFAVGTLAACAAVTPAQRVYETQANYTALLSIAEGYESLPRCLDGQDFLSDQCSDTKAVDLIRKADNDAWAAILAAQNAVRRPGASQSDTYLALAAAQEAVGALRTILINHGVLK